MSEQAFELGQTVKFSEHMIRRHAMTGEFMGPDKVWSSATYRGGKKRLQGGEGVIVGKRTLTNGDTIWTGDTTTYRVRESFTAYLIAYDLRRKPVHVLPEHITAVTA